MRYRVTLNWYGEVHTFWTSTDKESRAEFNAMDRLARKVQMSRYYVRQYFYGRDKVRVEREVKSVSKS